MLWESLFLGRHCCIFLALSSNFVRIIVSDFVRTIELGGGLGGL